MGCLTLLSDIGQQDATIAAVKGLCLQHLPDEQVIDIAHNVEPFHTQQAAYLLSAAYPHFPAKSYHIVLCDIFYSNKATLVMAEYNGSYILAPDNGILSLSFSEEIGEVKKCHIVEPDDTIITWANKAIDVIMRHSKDSNVIKQLADYTLQNAPKQHKAQIDSNSIECHVIHIDRFENVILNIRKEQFEEARAGRSFIIRFMRDDNLEKMSSNYFDVEEGKKLCRFNSAGYLEIAINRGRAASLFGFRLVRERQLIYNTIKIEFL